MSEDEEDLVSVGFHGSSIEEGPREVFIWTTRDERRPGPKSRIASVQEIVRSAALAQLLRADGRPTPRPRAEFAIGDVVVLKSGGEPMTVTDTGCCGVVSVSMWDGDRRLQETEFSAACLRLATKDETLPPPPF